MLGNKVGILDVRDHILLFHVAHTFSLEVCQPLFLLVGFCHQGHGKCFGSLMSRHGSTADSRVTCKDLWLMPIPELEILFVWPFFFNLCNAALKASAGFPGSLVATPYNSQTIHFQA